MLILLVATMWSSSFLEEEETKEQIRELSPFVLRYKLTHIYGFGSPYYGTYQEGKSDRDFICITSENIEEKIDIRDNQNMDLHIFSEKQFIEALENHDIRLIEALYHPILEEHKIEFTLDRSKLRSVLSQKCNISWVKAKKKLIVKEDRDIHIAKKSLFHCLRLFDFGIQLGNTGVIDRWDFKELYDEIMLLPCFPNSEQEADDYNSLWLFWEQQFKKRKNALASDFRKACPKN